MTPFSRSHTGFYWRPTVSNYMALSCGVFETKRDTKQDAGRNSKIAIFCIQHPLGGDSVGILTNSK